MTDTEYVTKYLIENNITISFMESCTSGLLASMFTDTQGASSVFRGSVVTYSNECKIAEGVDKSIIDSYGVYSCECARSMASAVKEKYKVDLAVGITGTTGNVDSNNVSSSVAGEAYYCIVYRDRTYDYHICLDVNGMTRKEIKQSYADAVYGSLKEILFEF